MKKHIVWIDISKQSLDIYDHYNEKLYKIQNKYKEIQFFLKDLDLKTKSNDINNDIYIVYEPTWVYWQELIKVINNLKFESFAIWLDTITQIWYALWDRNKNDKIDAQKIAFVWKMLLELLEKEFKNNSVKIRTIETPSNTILLAKNFITHIQALKDSIKKLKQYVHLTETQWFKELNSINKYYITEIKNHEKKIQEIYTEIRKIISELWYIEQLNNLSTMPWIWEESAILLTIFFIELRWKWLNKNDSAKVKASTWLEPKDKISWDYLKTSTISKRWDSLIRSWLWFSWMTWYNKMNNPKYCNTTIWKFAQRMKNKFVTSWNKKRAKSVICAIESKVITTAWAMFCDNKAYNYL